MNRNNNLPDAMTDQGLGVTQDDVEAVKWFRKAARQGLAPAQYNLGISYFNGQGVVKDQAAAVMWYRKAAGRQSMTNFINFLFPPSGPTTGSINGLHLKSKFLAVV